MMFLAGLLVVAAVLLLALRRSRARAGFSPEWHNAIDRQAWTQGYEGTVWQADKLDGETWRPGRIES